MSHEAIDPYDLERFVEAQAGVYEEVLSELRSARKRTHWIWFVFPQIEGLGFSEMTARYSISSLEEARAYLDHPILGRRLLECVEIMNAHEGRSAEEILGEIDAMKFRSSLTLFARASNRESPCHLALRKFYSGVPDAATEKIIG